MATLRTEITIPVHGDGRVTLIIDLPDIGSLSDRDRTFVLALTGKLADLAGAAEAHPGSPVMRQVGSRQ